MPRKLSPHAAFYRELAVLLGCQHPLNSALQTLVQKGSTPTVRATATELHPQSGDLHLSNVPILSLHPVATRALQADTATTESIVGALYGIADGIEKDRSFARRIQLALVYPIVVFCLFLALTAIIRVFVAPVFLEMYESMGSHSAGFLESFMEVSQLFPFLLVVLGLLLIPFVRRRALPWLPGFRRIYQCRDSIRATRATLLLRNLGLFPDEVLSGVNESLVHAGRPHFVAEEAWIRLFPPVLVEALRSSHSANLDFVLREHLESLEKQYRRLVDRLALISQISSMALIGTLVGAVAYSILFPVFNLSSVIS